MRIAIATGDYLVDGETFINRHVAHLFGGETVVVAGRWDGRNPLGRPVFVRRGRVRGAEIAAVPVALAANLIRHGTSRPPWGARKRALRAFLEDHGVGAVLAEFGTQALAVAPLAAEMGLPCFSYFRGTDASKALRRRQTVRAYRRMMPQLAGVFAVSRFLLDNLAAHGVTHPNARVIPSGVDMRAFRPGKKAAGFCLSVGRFVAKKAPEITLRAFAEAARAHPHALLEMVGDGPLLPRCRALAAELGVADRVALPGALPHDAVRDRLARAELFLQHSVTAADGNTEGLPTAIQEAMAAGCVIVATRHAGIPEAVTEGETGWLVAEHDGRAFAGRIVRALAADTAPMAAAARAAADARFDNARLLAELEAAIRASLAQA